MTMQKKVRRRAEDPRQMAFLDLLGGQKEDLIEVPEMPVPAPGALDFDQRMRDLLNKAIKASPFDREQIAALVSGLVGRDITKAQIDSWTGATRPNRFPAELIPAMCQALGNTVLLSGLAEACGCRLIEGRELQFARLGQLFLVLRQADAEAQRLVAELPLFGGQNG
ncbi:hypothetical protein [Telmatospirillum sp. J64-1]|uniref:hypothetical protein n=1 Tax=Telmatospirillum sp. J64-1 TaxID=2502183 RepID=UPI00115E5CE5|nr:hypothetical protein [Telmatospirillum sp. J64-1]